MCRRSASRFAAGAATLAGGEADSFASAARAEPRPHRREILGADPEVLAHPSPQHRGRDVAVAAFLLGLVQDVEDHPLLAAQSITNVRYAGVLHAHTIALTVPGCNSRN